MRTINAWHENGRDLSKVKLADEDPDYLKGPLSFFDEEKKARYVPYVIEPSAGIDRSSLAFLVDAYDEDEVNGEKRNVLRFHPALAPIKCAILPLVKKDGLPEIARTLYDQLKRRLNCYYDEKSAIGRRYRRQDEAGTPWCFTIDGQTKEDQTVTVRERDSLKQERIHLDNVLNFMRDKLDM
jgi:glycyl-tRNA synthetase